MDRAWPRGHRERVGRRGILPSLGAGTSLIVAGVLCLIVVSGYVAFRGFPGLGLDGSQPPLRLARPVADDASPRARAIVIGAASPSLASIRVASRVRSEARAERARGGSPRVGAPPPAQAPSSDPTPTPTPTPAPAAGADLAPPASSPVGEGQRTNQPAPQVRPVRDTVDQVRNVLAPVAPPPPPAAQPVVDEVAGAVDQTVDAVDQTLGALLPDVQQAGG
jgi:hypothetical protein